MNVYINGTGVISPQATIIDKLLEGELTNYEGNRLNNTEPDYSLLIDAKMIRRMSRIVKMGVTSALLALNEAGIKQPDGVITGTGYGCLEDTTVFLKKLVENKEEMLNPTAFIYSTHNTIAAQIAYILQNKGYNNTYSHRNISFESALLDAFLLIGNGEYKNLIVGGLDELTDTSFNVLSKFGLFKKEKINTLELFQNQSKGTIAGEGSAFFVLSNEPGQNCHGKLLSIKTISFKPTSDAALAARAITSKNGLDSPDLIISGDNGDTENDAACKQFLNETGFDSPVINFKQLCGEYPTSTAFAFWLGATIIKSRKTTPSLAGNSTKSNAIKNVLIYNRNNTHQSLILMAAC